MLCPVCLTLIVDTHSIGIHYVLYCGIVITLPIHRVVNPVSGCIVDNKWIVYYIKQDSVTRVLFPVPDNKEGGGSKIKMYPICPILFTLPWVLYYSPGF